MAMGETALFLAASHLLSNDASEASIIAAGLGALDVSTVV